MAIYEEVLAWAGNLPLWRQDALRRLCIQDSWDEADLNEILDLAKQHHGISSALDDALDPVPFAAEHFPAEANQDVTVTLSSLHTLVNVGRIPSDQVLTFQRDGLTIAYGGNGTGKTGYARVLKQACRARSPGTVYANAYDPNFRQLTPSAIIDFELDGVAVQTRWSGQHNHPTRPELRGISVFDGECARHYLQTKEAATFQPVALTYLQQLANGLNQILRPRLLAEIAGLAVESAPFNVIDANTEAGRAIHPIGVNTALGRARQLATLSEEEVSELERLPKEISEADPTSKAALLDNAATKVDEFVITVLTASAWVSDEAFDNAHSAGRVLADAELAERAASALLQAEDATTLLPGTGQGPWSLLFKAAREYSSSTAYPQEEFPVTGADAKCVLCQQDLTTEAKDRLRRFDRYVREAAAEAARVARNAWQQIVREAGQANVAFTISQNMSDSLGRRVATLPDEIRTFQEDLASRLQWFNAVLLSGDWTARPTYRCANPTAQLRQIASSLRADATSLRANLDQEVLEAKRLRLKELEARQLLSNHIESIHRVIVNLQLKAKLQSCLNDIGNTRAITIFAGQLARRYLSAALTAKVNEELTKLDLYHIQAGVSSAGDVGSVRLGILLPDSQLDPHLVLSEAEQRMCALAYFLAELHQSGSTSGIVFDDPVSSLDHNHRTAVARRIIEESAIRQVVVFTHDAVFFGELTTLCEDADLTPDVKSIAYRSDGPGYIDAGLPYDMRKHQERITQHLAEHQRIAAVFNNPPGDAERLLIRNVYDDLRVTIEVGIEDTLLNGTVVRFRDNISVGRLDGVMIVEDSEYRDVQRLHDKCCRNVRAHSHAAGQQRAVTQPAELLRDIEAVNTLFRTIRSRRG